MIKQFESMKILQARTNVHICLNAQHFEACMQFYRRRWGMSHCYSVSHKVSLDEKHHCSLECSICTVQFCCTVSPRTRYTFDSQRITKGNQSGTSFSCLTILPIAREDEDCLCLHLSALIVAR